MLGLELDEFAETPETSEDILHELTELTTSQILDCPIILDDILEFYYETNPEDTVLEGITNWTLYEVVGAILSDLSTYCFIKGFFSKADDLASSPLTGTELFDYLDTLDNFFNRKN
jgi:hypothetical protein